MLCSKCEEHFTFARPDIVENCKRNKQNAIDYAVAQGFDESHLTTLRRDLARYQQQLDAQTQHVFPRPWSTDRNFGDLFPVSECVAVWEHIPYHRTWKDLRLSASRSDCQLCMTLVAMIQYSTKGGEMESTQQITSDWLTEGGSGFPFRLRFHINQDNAPAIMLHFHVSIDSSDHIGVFFDLDTVIDEIPRATRIPRGTSTEDQTCIEFLSQTLSNCLSTHASCAPSRVNSAWVPKRLLDVGLGLPNSGSIVLVEGDDLRASAGEHQVRYLTLSHLWGSCRPATLSKANYGDMKKGVKFAEFPRCFRDAINVTRSLGVRYLWIDALCIVQDSEQDWMEQAACMDKVYLGGVCNIAACDISDSRDSLFSSRDPHVGGAIVHRQIYTDYSAVFTVAPDWPRVTWDNSNLYRRGWVMQERWLSPRIIHFSQFPIWECRSGLVTEGFPLSDGHRTSDSFSGFPESQREWLFAHQNKMGIIQRWWEVVDHYTQCSLTYPSDKLVAIAGMARVFSTLTNEPYYAGIWGGEHLVLSLLWHRMPICSLPAAMATQSYRAPSWSWAALDGHILTREYSLLVQPLAEFVSAHLVPKSEDIFGQLINGELTLRGILFRIPNPTEHKYALVGWLDYQRRTNFEIPLYFLPLAELRPLVLPPHAPQPRTFGGLFVQVAENFSGKRAFQRIGCMQVNQTRYPQLLDADQWEKLENLHSPVEQGELITLV